MFVGPEKKIVLNCPSHIMLHCLFALKILVHTSLMLETKKKWSVRVLKQRVVLTYLRRKCVNINFDLRLSISVRLIRFELGLTP